MNSKKDIYIDNEYFIMNEIINNKNVTQRKLSQKLGLSLGSVNVLINKMTKEGFIRTEYISQKQVMYMLTPKGVIEKGNKTISYLKKHYKIIYEIKEKIKLLFSELSIEYENVVVIKPSDEIGEIIDIALNEYNRCVKNINIKELKINIF